MVGIVVLTLTAGLSPASDVQAAEYQLAGSDTLTGVVKQALIVSGYQYDPIGNPVGLSYLNGGSGMAEKGFCQLGNFAVYQSLAPMSRGLNASCIGRFPINSQLQSNVVGLEAAIVVSRRHTNRCRNISAPLADPSDPTLALPDSTLALILGGPGALGSGTVAACASPQRLSAIADLAACAGVPELSHFYRSDDRAGTSETMRERLQVSRYCNGRAPGVGNLNNDDNDPVRRACIAADATHAQSRCTYYPTGVTCTAGSGPDAAGRPCTQGFLVALSESDPGATDIAVSIANRVKNDTFNTTMGFANREAARQPGLPTAGLTVNTVNFSDNIVRMNQYMFTRRLHVFRNPYFMTVPAAGDAMRFALETGFWEWMTADRCHMDPIVEQNGFIACVSDCTAAPAGAHVCALPLPAYSAPVSPCLPAGADCGTGSAVCCSTGTMCSMGGQCPAPVGLAAGYACSVNADCASGSCIIGSNPVAGICG